MKQTCRVFKSWILIGLLFLLGGCNIPAPPAGPQPPPGWAVTTIALPRITYGDAGPDPFCHGDLYDQVHWMVKRALERKGYTVVNAEMPAKDNSNRPDPWARVPGGQLLPLLPSAADGLLRVRVDRYLDLDLCSGEQIRMLEMDATAELFVAASTEPVWSAQGKGADTSISRSEDLPFRVSAELANQLLLTLPMAPR